MSVSARALWVQCAAMVLCLAAPAPAEAAPVKGKKPGKVKPVKTSKSPLEAALSDKAPQVQDCAMKHALDKGAKRVDIKVHVTINNQGSLVDSQITVNADGGDSAQVKSCVETAVRSATFPKINTPLATADKSWTLATQ